MFGKKNKKLEFLILLSAFADIRLIQLLIWLQDYFHVSSISGNSEEISSAVYLQVSIVSQALIFVTRSQSWSFLERPGTLLMCAFVLAQLVRVIKTVKKLHH